MKQKRIRLGALLLSLFLLAGCTGTAAPLPGEGTPGVLEHLPWQTYDDCLQTAAGEKDPLTRAMILHKAEDLLMDSGALIPLYHGAHFYMQNADITNVFPMKGDLIDITHIHREGASPEEPLSVLITSEPQHLDPAAGTAGNIMNILVNTGAGLLRRGEDESINCDLAESYTVSEDGRTYVFILRDALKWSDGSPLTAADFAYSWSRAASSECAMEYGNLFQCIHGYPDDLDVSASEDGKTFTVNLDYPCPYFPELCTMTVFFPVNRQEVESAPGYRDASGKLLDPSAWAREAGTLSCGAYVADEWVHSEKITLQKNPYYYDAENVRTDTVYLMLSTDSTSAYAAYRSGDICLLSGNISSDLIPSLSNDPEFHSVPILATTSMTINVNAPIFEGMTAEEAKTFRKAIGWAIDRSFIVDVALTGEETPATTYIPLDMQVGMDKPFGSTPGYTYPEESGYYGETADLDRARQMLTSIGFEFDEDGKLKEPLTLEYKYNPSAGNEMIAVCLQADLAQLGIRMMLASREWNVFLGERSNGDFEMCRESWNADYNDPGGMLVLFESNSPNNSTQLGK